MRMSKASRAFKRLRVVEQLMQMKIIPIANEYTHIYAETMKKNNQ